MFMQELGPNIRLQWLAEEPAPIIRLLHISVTQPECGDYFHNHPSPDIDFYSQRDTRLDRAKAITDKFEMPAYRSADRDTGLRPLTERHPRRADCSHPRSCGTSAPPVITTEPLPSMAGSVSQRSTPYSGFAPPAEN
jgi:hypothetical protein